MKHLLCAFLIFFTSLSFSQQLEVVDFTRVDAKLSFDIEASKVLGVVDYYFNILKPTDSVFLDAVHMDFKEVLLNNKRIPYTNTTNHLVLPAAFKAGESYRLRVAYQAQPKKALYFVGWQNEAPDQIWTQGQGKYTSNWLPSLDDTNDKMEFDLTVTFNSAYKVVANGSLLAKETIAGNTIWKYDMAKPMSSYLVALAIGEYNKLEEVSGSGIPLEMYFYPADSLRAEPTYRYSK